MAVHRTQRGLLLISGLGMEWSACLFKISSSECGWCVQRKIDTVVLKR